MGKPDLNSMYAGIITHLIMSVYGLIILPDGRVGDIKPCYLSGQRDSL